MTDKPLPVPGVTANPDWAPMLNEYLEDLNSEAVALTDEVTTGRLSEAALARKASVHAETHAAVVAAQNSTTEATVAAFAFPSDMQAGDRFRLVVEGTALNNSGSTVNMTFRAKINGSNLLQAFALPLGASANTRRVYVTVDFVFSGTKLHAAGNLSVGNPTTAASWQPVEFTYVGDSSTSGTLSLTPAPELTFTAQAGTAATTVNFTMNSGALLSLGKVS